MDSSSSAGRSRAWAGTEATRHGGHRDQRGGAGPALQVGALTEERPGPVLGQALAVDLDAKHAVEDQVDLGALVALAYQVGARFHFLDLRFGRPAHHSGGQRTLEGGLDDGDEGLGLLVAPGRVRAEGLAVPVLEVDEARLAREMALVVVDPVAREPAGSDERPLGVGRRHAG